MVVVYDHTVQEHHFVSSGTLMALTCDLLGTKIGETAQCVAHDLAATFALLELILKLKTSNLQTEPSLCRVRETSVICLSHTPRHIKAR